MILSDRVVVMSQRPGSIAAVQDIDLPRPRTIETRASEGLGRLSLEIYRALNRSNVMPAQVGIHGASDKMPSAPHLRRLRRCPLRGA